MIRPDGEKGIYGVVEFPLGIGVLPITADGKVILLKQYRYTLKSDSWEVVNGTVDAGEGRTITARRELEEEAGLKAKSLKYMGSFWPSAGITDEVEDLFLATGLSQVKSKPEGTESFQRKTFTYKKALEMIEKGLIKESCTVILLLKAKKFIKG